MASSWIDLQHPEFRQLRARWQYARDHYTGEVVAPERIAEYLVQRTSGESAEAFAERAANADYTPHFATVVDSLAGMLFQNEDDATRVWQNEQGFGLGDVADATSPAGRLWHDADGAGGAWEGVWRALATELLVTQTHWVLVDTIAGADAEATEPVLRLIAPTRVPNWRVDAQGLAEVLVEEERDTRRSLRDTPDAAKSYVLYTRDGWQRYRREGAAEPTPDGPLVPYRYETRTGALALPLFRVQLPMRRFVGYMLARKAGVIFNQESARDHLLRVANFPKFLVDVSDDTAYNSLVSRLKKGANVLAGVNHKYAAPDSGPATVATDVLKRKVEEFYITAFREYGDAARQRTATEVRQDVASGVGALLGMLKSAIDAAENEALWRIEQTLYARDRRHWFHARVARSSEFVVTDVAQMIDRLRTWAFGPNAVIPLGRTAQIAAATQLATWAGYEAGDGEIAAAVDLANLQRIVDAGRDLPLPPAVQARLVVQLARAAGIVAPSEAPMAPLTEGAVLAEAEDEAAEAALAAQQRREALGAVPPAADDAADDDDAAPAPIGLPSPA